MKLIPRRTGLLLVICAAVSCSSLFAFQKRRPEPPLDNAAVVKLVRAGFHDKTLISIIGSRDVHFDLTPDRLIDLKKQGVPEKIILAMIARQEGDTVFDDEVAYDGSFDFPPLSSRSGQPSSGNETNIFGSSGGSRGRSKSTAGRGGNVDDTVTTGSATVRIVRPPAESGGGGAAPKLERTPTLTNDSISDLVQAGFSEGTIIRQIQNSPVDFDLSPGKIDELHRRHVTDPIISAMRTAMADDSSSPTGPSKPQR